MRTLKNFQAEVTWLCAPWDSVTVKKQTGRDGQFRLITGTPAAQWYRGTTTDLTINPANLEPDFWRKVRQWGLAFENNAEEEVQGYYRIYGPLQCLPKKLQKEVRGVRWLHGEESWEINQEALGWFNLLTSMMERLKEGRLTALWEYFGDPRFCRDAREGEEPLGSLWFYPKDYNGIDIPFFSIRWFPWPAPGLIGKTDYYLPTPQDDEDVLQATWDVIVEEVTRMLGEIRLIPATTGDHNSRNITWNFWADNAFEAAFLQWYFQEVADFSPSGERKKCPSCGDYLPLKKSPGSNRVYCKEQCRKKAWYERKRTSS